MHLSLFTTFCSPIFWFAHPIFFTRLRQRYIQTFVGYIRTLHIGLRFTATFWQINTELIISLIKNSTITTNTHRRRLWGQPGHVPPIIEKRPCIYHCLPPSVPIFWFAHPIFLISLRQCKYLITHLARHNSIKYG